MKSYAIALHSEDGDWVVERIVDETHSFNAWLIFYRSGEIKTPYVTNSNIIAEDELAAYAEYLRLRANDPGRLEVYNIKTAKVFTI